MPDYFDLKRVSVAGNKAAGPSTADRFESPAIFTKAVKFVGAFLRFDIQPAGNYPPCFIVECWQRSGSRLWTSTSGDLGGNVDLAFVSYLPLSPPPLSDMTIGPTVIIVPIPWDCWLNEDEFLSIGAQDGDGTLSDCVFSFMVPKL